MLHLHHRVLRARCHRLGAVEALDACGDGDVVGVLQAELAVQAVAHGHDRVRAAACPGVDLIRPVMVLHARVHVAVGAPPHLAR